MFIPSSQEEDFTASERRFLDLIGPMVTGEKFPLGRWGAHSLRVARDTFDIALAMGAAEEWARRYLFGAFLHDKGKLSKDLCELFDHDRPYTADEQRRARRHTRVGVQTISAEMLQGLIGLDSESLWQIKAAQITHHTNFCETIDPEHFAELFPGRQYEPLSGKEIPLVGRLVAVADTFDALVSDRGYKRTWSSVDACLYLKKQAGTMFDPEIVGFFLSKSRRTRKIRIRCPRLQVFLMPLTIKLKDRLFAFKRVVKRRVGWL